MTNEHYLFEDSEFLKGFSVHKDYKEMLSNENSKTKEKLKKQMNTYGISQYSAYSMEYNMYVTLYVNLKSYMLYANDIINLEFHKVEYLGETFTQLEMINKMISILEEAIEFDYYDYNGLTQKEYTEKLEYFKTVYDIYKIISVHMWY